MFDDIALSVLRAIKQTRQAELGFASWIVRRSSVASGNDRSSGITSASLLLSAKSQRQVAQTEDIGFIERTGHMKYHWPIRPKAGRAAVRH